MPHFVFKKRDKSLGGHDGCTCGFRIGYLITAEIEPEGNETPGYATTYIAGSTDAGKRAQGLDNLHGPQPKLLQQGKGRSLCTVIK